MFHYHSIQTEADIARFDEVSNGLHDGHIIQVDYRNTGISCCDGGLQFDYDGLSLTIHVLVTSLPGHPTFELLFHNVPEWQIRQYQFFDMIGFSIVRLDNGYFLWADDISSHMEDLKQGSYVIAGSIRWRKL